ncbi:MAG: hypothetical protein IKM87_02045 [Clostridia bacterium]|nr:hypothetical protein [Clostridia bacterium]
MITVPDTIKDLYHLDHCYKNIRIHFPNGERSDICNDLIVKDSVSFKESLCSQNTLKFGLCEASVFECETVGVGNVKGAVIEVFCEIECPATVSGSEWKVDLQKYVYPISYGTFIIQEATRQADMIHRRITAYNIMSGFDFKLTKFQLFRANYPNSELSPFVQRLIPLIIENMQTNAFNCVQTEVSGYKDFRENYRRDPSPGTIMKYLSDKYRGYRITQADSSKLYRVVIDDPNPNVQVRYTCMTSRSGTPYTNMYAFTYPPEAGGETLFPRSRGGLSEFFIYPYMSMTAAADNSAWFKPSSASDEGAYISVYYGISTYYEQSGQPHWNENNFIDPDDIHIYELTVPDTVYYSFERVMDINGKFVIADPDQINLRTLFSGYLETCGLFGFIGRDNKFKTLNIKRQFHLVPSTVLYPNLDRYPEGVTGGELLPEDYKSCWYDDEYTKPFGLITCQFKDLTNQDCTYQLYLTGYDENTDPDTYQTYTVDNNDLIKNALWTMAQIGQICNNIANNIENVRYMPVDFAGRGLPYVEAGDTFEILTKSNDSITTIVLNRTIKGEQTLTDEYKSV